MAQNYDPVTRLFFLRGEGAPDFGSDAERRKEIRRDSSTIDHLRAFTLGSGNQACLIVVTSDRFKGVVLAPPIEEIGIGTVDRVAALGVCGWHAWRKLYCVDSDEAVVVWERQRTEQYAVNQGEDGGGGSDAKGERHDPGQSEAGTAPKLAEGKG